MFINHIRSSSQRSCVCGVVAISITLFGFGAAVYFTTFVQANSFARCFEKMKKELNTECCVLQNQQMESIDVTEFLCCNGTVSRLANNVDCCRDRNADTSVLYTTTHSMCCNGHIHNILNGDDDDCCGDKLYNKKTQLCCTWDDGGSTDHHIYDITPNRTTCPIYLCNKEPYDLKQYMCCNDQLVRAKDNHACCGTKSFNWEKRVCCNGEIYKKKHEKQQCCGKRYMDDGEGCCGEEILKTNEKCCGDQSYISSLSICTAESKVEPIGTPLCANRKYDPEKQVCCGSFAMTKNNPDDNACCKPRGHTPGVTFNNNNMTCQNGKLYSTVKCSLSHTPDQYTCCNGFAYKQPAKNSVCCAGRADWFKRNSNQEDCRSPLCENKWYDDEDQDCCNDKLINRRKFRCIDGKSYRYWVRSDNLLPNLRHCGEYAISKYFSCCAGIMPYKSRKYACPFSDFGYQRPLKPRNFPFWPIIKCQSEKKSGRLTDVELKNGTLTIVFTEKGSRKRYSISVSNTQDKQILSLIDRRASVDVYFEKSEENTIFLGEYGAIVHGRDRKRKQNKLLCKQIRTLFHTDSS